MRICRPALVLLIGLVLGASAASADSWGPYGRRIVPDPTGRYYVVLTGVTAVHVASGGVAGSEGAIVLALTGEEDVVKAAFELVESVKGEEQFEPPRLIPYIREPENAPSRV